MTVEGNTGINIEALLDMDVDEELKGLHESIPAEWNIDIEALLDMDVDEELTSLHETLPEDCLEVLLDSKLLIELWTSGDQSHDPVACHSIFTGG